MPPIQRDVLNFSAQPSPPSVVYLRSHQTTMKNFPLLLTALILSSLAGLADDRDNRKRPGAELTPKERLENLFAEIDKNKDGSIAFSEFKSAPFIREAKRKEVESVFYTVDADLNGSLNKPELAKGMDKIRTMLRNSKAVMDDGDSRSSRRQLRKAMRD